MLTISSAAQRRQSTTRYNLKTDKTLIVSDTSKVEPKFIITVEDGDTTYRLSGFDKPLNSLYETMFLTNNSNFDLVGIYFTIEYFDRAGRQLNKANRSLYVDIPAGETRQVRWGSWDRQQSFFYVGSRKPRTRATGFDIKCRVDSVEIKR
ncbi:MAG: hypothetical protein K2H59_03605 [Muribaculaceae bacterium]|nr:hypothetical protein [Muribaculaceae bacterium]